MSDRARERDGGDFASQLEGPRAGLVREFVEFLRENKKWWLTPVVVVLLLLGVLVVIGGGSLAPFIYTLF